LAIDLLTKCPTATMQYYNATRQVARCLYGWCTPFEMVHSDLSAFLFQTRQRQENPNMATSQRPHLRRRDMPRRQAGGGAPRARHGRVGTHTDSRDEVAHRLIATGDHGHRRDTAHHHHHHVFTHTEPFFPRFAVHANAASSISTAEKLESN
jgi:hypothetical protein